jgi:hypothetical protein
MSNVFWQEEQERQVGDFTFLARLARLAFLARF